MFPDESMTIRRLSVAMMNPTCFFEKHKQINGAPLYMPGRSWDIRCDGCWSACGAFGPPGNQSCNTSPFSIWHFLPRRGKHGGEASRAVKHSAQDRSPCGPPHRVDTHRGHGPMTTWGPFAHFVSSKIVFVSLDYFFFVSWSKFLQHEKILHTLP